MYSVLYLCMYGFFSSLCMYCFGCFLLSFGLPVIYFCLYLCIFSVFFMGYFLYLFLDLVRYFFLYLC